MSAGVRESSRSAIDAILRGRHASFVPLHDAPWSDTVDKWVKQGMPTDANGKAVNAEDHFGFDMAGCGGWFKWQAVYDREVILEENEQWKIVRNGNGAVLKWWKTHSGTPEHIDFHMSSRAIWERDYRPKLVDFDPKRVDVEGARKNLALRRGQEKWTYFGHQFIWECLRASLGDVAMYMALIEDPEWIHDFNRVHTDMWKSCYAYLFEQVGKPDGVWVYEDLGYRDKLFCSPKVLAEVIFPYYAELVDFFHGYDLPVVLHSCGYQAPMIPLAIEAGFDGLNPMEVKAGNDIFAYAEKYGDKLAFVGGFDAVILESSDRELIRRRVIDFMVGMKKRGARFVYGSDHSLSTNIDYDDFLYSLEVYRELAEY